MNRPDGLTGAARLSFIVALKKKKRKKIYGSFQFWPCLLAAVCCLMFFMRSVYCLYATALSEWPVYIVMQKSHIGAVHEYC